MKDNREKNIEIRNAKYEIRNTKYEIRNTKYEIRNTFLNKPTLTVAGELNGNRKLECRIQNSEFRMMNAE